MRAGGEGEVIRDGIPAPGQVPRWRGPPSTAGPGTTRFSSRRSRGALPRSRRQPALRMPSVTSACKWARLSAITPTGLIWRGRSPRLRGCFTFSASVATWRLRAGDSRVAAGCGILPGDSSVTIGVQSSLSAPLPEGIASSQGPRVKLIKNSASGGRGQRGHLVRHPCGHGHVAGPHRRVCTAHRS